MTTKQGMAWLRSPGLPIPFRSHLVVSVASVAPSQSIVSRGVLICMNAMGSRTFLSIGGTSSTCHLAFGRTFSLDTDALSRTWTASTIRLSVFLESRAYVSTPSSDYSWMERSISSGEGTRWSSKVSLGQGSSSASLLRSTCSCPRRCCRQLHSQQPDRFSASHRAVSRTRSACRAPR